LLVLAVVLPLLLALALPLVPTRVMAPLAPVASSAGLDGLGLENGHGVGQRQEPQQRQQATAGAGGGEDPSETINGERIHLLLLQDDP
jgi:hypothetical protein